MATGSQIMQKHVPSTLESTSDPESRSKKLVSIGKVEGKVDLILQIKMLFASIRPLLHSLLLMVPTVLIACLVGQRPAIQLMAVLALSIEAAQVAFGYGFDRLDVFDLFADSVGILIGIILYRWVQRSSHPLLIRLVKRRHEGGAPAA
jgi:glycopeptide antibiotics resistance protein